MLQSIRDKAQGWFAYLVVAFISIPFVFWGIQQYLGTGDKQVAAKVDGTEISVVDFQRALQSYNQRLRDMFGGRLPEEMLKGDLAQQTVISGMVRDVVKYQYSLSHGLRVSDEQLLEEIRSTPIFQENGTFSLRRYDQLLSQQRLSKAGFEAQIRQDMLGGQLETALSESTFLTPAQVDELASLRGQKRDIRYAVIDRNRFAGDIKIDDADIEKYYERNQAVFMAPERVKLQYLLLDEKELAAQVSVSEAELRAFYNEHIEQFTKPAVRRVSQILVKVGEAESADAAAQTKAAELVSKLRSGAYFEELAKNSSDDSLSAAKGGDLGWISKGEFDPEIEEVIFRLKPGEISDPVKTGGGFRILKVTEIAAAEQRPFEAARADVEREFRQRQVEKLMVEKADQLATLTYETPDSLEPAASALGLTVQTTEWVTANAGEGIASDPKVRAAAFSDVVLRQKHNSDVLDLGGGRDVVLRVGEHEPARPIPLDQVRERIRAQLTEDRLHEAAVRAGESAISRLGAETLEQVAQSLGASVKSPGWVTRGAKDVPPEVLQTAFRLGKPQADKPLAGGTPLGDGNFAVVQVLKVEQPEVKLSAADARPGTTAAVSSLAQRQVDALLDTIQSRADVQIFTENLKR